MQFPTTRMRRLRGSAAMRRLVRETRLSPSALIYPVFVQAGRGSKDEISSMPGQYRWTVDLLPELVRTVANAGIGALVLFGLPETKDEVGSGAYDPDGVVQRASRQIKDVAP